MYKRQVIGALLIAAELFIPSGILGIGGIIAIVFGAVYLIDVSLAPDMSISYQFIVPVAVFSGCILLLASRVIYKAMRVRRVTGEEGLVGQIGEVIVPVSTTGKVFVSGEYWDSKVANDVTGIIEKGSRVKVVEVSERMVLVVKKVGKRSGVPR